MTEARQRGRRGAGSFRTTATGRIEYRIGGRSFYGRTQAECRAKAKAAADEPQATRTAGSSRAALADWLAPWLERQKATLRPQTWRQYESHVRLYLAPILGHVRLDRLTADHVDQLREAVLAMPTNRKAGTVSPTTARHVHMTLNAALKDAVARGVIAKAPTAIAKAPKRSTKAITTLTPDEVGRLLDAAAAWSPHASLYVVAASLGMREGELLALRWEDVDLGTPGYIRVTGSVGRGWDGKVQIGPPKTANGLRTLSPLPRAVRAALAATERRGEYVWPNVDGQPMSGQTLYSDWTRTRRAAKLKKHVRFHDLRHTVATSLLDKGIAPQTVALVLGDRVETIMATYAHATSRGLGLAMEAIDAA